MMKSNNAEHAFELCEAMLNLGGLGHTAVIQKMKSYKLLLVYV